MERKSLAVGCVAGLVIGGVVALISAQIVESTAKPNFCASCHEMKVMVEAWKKGPHGPEWSKNTGGAVRAGCTDCHLPHGNVVGYLVTKGISGTRDFIAHLFSGNIDKAEYWLEKRNERNKYVYVENCKHCHENFPDNPVHKMFKEGKIKGDCLTCHFYVGHGNNLENDIKAFFAGEKNDKIESEEK
jgi:trimethylamine-N-oxide reductase (cytochrome c) cytochrome c-type subunit TorY